MNIASLCLICTACFLLIANRQVQAAIAASTTIAPRCLQETSKKCVIVSLSLEDPSQEVALPVLSGRTTLQIKRGNLTAFSAKLAEHLGTVEKLQLGPLNLRKIFLKPELVELSAGGNQIDTVEFPTQNGRFKLQMLDLSANRLKDLTGFEVLVNLRELHLENNAIESVDMQVFKDMKLLERLFLDRNQISTVHAVESLELPVLEYLSLSGNQIEKLDATKWQMDSLTKWDVSANKLNKIEGNLEERFPSLQMISVAKNEWHCKWLEDTLQRFNESFVAVQDRDEDCQGISPANICCIPEPQSSVNDARLNDLKKLEMKQIDHRAEFESQFGKVKNDNDNQLKNLESRLKKLEDLEKKKNEESAAGDSNPMESKFESLKQSVQNIELSFNQKQKSLTEQQRMNELTHHKLRLTMLELSNSLKRDAKQIAELQGQFNTLRDLVRNTLENRDKLMA